MYTVPLDPGQTMQRSRLFPITFAPNNPEAPLLRLQFPVLAGHQPGSVNVYERGGKRDK